MHVLFVCVFGLALLLEGLPAFGRGSDDPTWKLRWRALDPGYRDWLAAMTTSPAWLAMLTDPQEVELAKGFARRERRRRAYFGLAAIVVLGLAFALTASGLLSSSICVLGLSSYLLLKALAERLRDRQIRGRVPQQEGEPLAPAV